MWIEVLDMFFELRASMNEDILLLRYINARFGAFVIEMVKSIDFKRMLNFMLCKNKTLSLGEIHSVIDEVFANAASEMRVLSNVNHVVFVLNSESFNAYQ